MFPLKVLNRLRAANDVAAEVTPTLPNHKAWLLVRPQVDPQKAEWDKISRRWQSIYVDEDILAGFKVNYVEIETRQLDVFFSNIDIDIEPTINERFQVTSEEELAVLVSRWLTDLSGFRDPYDVNFRVTFAL